MRFWFIRRSDFSSYKWFSGWVNCFVGNVVGYANWNGEWPTSFRREVAHSFIIYSQSFSPLWRNLGANYYSFDLMLYRWEGERLVLPFDTKMIYRLENILHHHRHHRQVGWPPSVVWGETGFCFLLQYTHFALRRMFNVDFDQQNVDFDQQNNKHEKFAMLFSLSVNLNNSFCKNYSNKVCVMSMLIRNDNLITVHQR